MLAQCYNHKVLSLAFLLLVLGIATSAQAQKNSNSFTVRLMNLTSTAKETFRFNGSLHNGTGHTQQYELTAAAPEGWITAFRTEGSQISAIRLDSGRTQDISIEFTPSPAVKPGKYTIPVKAITNGDTLRTDLEAVVKGDYAVELSTPSGRLSDNITEGRSRQIELTVKNTGTLPLEALELSSQTPVNWNATFTPAKIERLDPGQTSNVIANLSVPDKTIAGDYVTNFTVRNNNVNSNAAFRMTVKTSPLSGWLGILAILIALGIVYYLIRKYGRR